MKNALRIGLLGTLASAAVLASGPTPEKTIVTEDNVFKLSTTMKRVTEKPYRVPGQMMALCGYSGQTTVSGGNLSIDGTTKPSIPAKRDVSSVKPPRDQDFSHAYMGMHVYLNALAEEALGKKAAPYPVGAMIVKEKLDASGAVAGVGGMVKRAPGFDADNGNWEYFYADKGGKLSQGRLDTCANCHSEAQKTDFVFARWSGK